jgi:heat-inducible transcriptional repressor
VSARECGAVNERRQRILGALVQEYVRSAQPVSSQVLVDRYDLGCSAATVRHELSALEESGHAFQPHVSAGRMPTDLGYRVFVDAMAGRHADDLTADEVLAVQMHYSGVEQGVQGLLAETADLLARLTSYVAVVVSPSVRRHRVRRMDLVRIGDEHVLAVVITDRGEVLERHVTIPGGTSEIEVETAEEELREAVVGQTAEDVRRTAAAGGLDVSGGVARTVLLELVGSLDDLGRGPLYHGGTQALLEEPEFEDPAMVRSLVGVLEDGLVLAGVLSDALRRHEVLVRIGAENREDALDHMSVVASTYDAAGAEGVVGLLGPTRMDYGRAITTVRFVAEELSDSLAGGDRDGS